MIEIISKQYNYLLLKSSSFRLLKTKQNVIAVIEFVLLFHIENILKNLFSKLFENLKHAQKIEYEKKRNMICDSVNDANKNNEKKRKEKLTHALIN